MVCVDELDRCRPEYALSLLEVTRHLFDMPGVVVLLDPLSRWIHKHAVAVSARRGSRHLQPQIARA